MRKNSLKIAPYTKKYQYDGNTKIDLGWVLEEKVYGKPGEELKVYSGPIDWRPNEPFRAQLTIVTTYDSKFYLEDETTHTFYTITNSDMCSAIMEVDVINGKISGEWQVVKKNIAYSLALINP